MCANCGCRIPEEAHDDERNILWSEVEASALAAGISTGDAMTNILEMARDRGAL